jgi:nitric oxide dioxygenase
MISALNRIARTTPNRQVTFAHAARASEYHAHRADVDAAKAAMPNLVVATFHEKMSPEDELDALTYSGMMDVRKVPAWPNDADVYICGPVAFMQDQWRTLIDTGVSANRLHREVFGPELMNYMNWSPAIRAPAITQAGVFLFAQRAKQPEPAGTTVPYNGMVHHCHCALRR